MKVKGYLGSAACLLDLFSAMQQFFCLNCCIAAGIEVECNTNLQGQLIMKTDEGMTRAGAEWLRLSAVDPCLYAELYRKSTAPMESLKPTALNAAEGTAGATEKWAMHMMECMRSSFATDKYSVDSLNAVKEFAALSNESGIEHMAACTEIAKQAQMESAEFMLGGAS